MTLHISYIFIYLNNPKNNHEYMIRHFLPIFHDYHTIFDGFLTVGNKSYTYDIHIHLSESPASYWEYPARMGRAWQATRGVFDMPKTVTIGLIPLTLREPLIIGKDE